MAIRYRPEIDGLRTVAVVSVLIYHLKVALSPAHYLFGGGFLGVDMFFVISGFLITSILLREIHAEGRISIARFYERRARRILPALFVVLFATLAAGAVLLVPSEFVTLGKSTLAAIFFVSNLFWMDTLSTYGATSGMYQPLLHTWSLGVEEQFYIFFPLFLLLLVRFSPRSVTWVMVAGGVLGLVACQAITLVYQPLSFYGLQSRAWELLAGSSLAALTLSHPQALKGGVLTRIMPPLGLLLVLVPIVFTHLDPRWHPGLQTLPVILGTCAIIWWADERSWTTRLLASKPFVGIGLISYSLYLWHYPVFAYGRMISLEPGLVDYAIWFAISFGGAYLSYRYIEAPFRQKGRFEIRALTKGFVATGVVLCACVGVILAGRGWEQRLPKLLALYGDSDMDNGWAMDASWSILDKLSPDETIDSWNARDASEHEKHDDWFGDAGDRRKYLLVGNSHSKDTFNAVYLNPELFPHSAFARFALTHRFDADEVADLRASPNYKEADEIVITTRFEQWLPRKLENFIRTVEMDGKQVTILGPAVEYGIVGPLTVYDWYLQTRGRDRFDVDELDHIGWEYRYPRNMLMDAALEQIAYRTGARLLWKEDYTCDKEVESCVMATPDGRKVYFDYSHYTLDGARYFGQRMAEMGWFQPEGEAPAS